MFVNYGHVILLHMTFINAFSYKCLLGPQSKNIIENNNIYAWKVGKKQHFTTSRQLQTSDLMFLTSICPSNFHYLSEDNTTFLKQHFTLHRIKNTSIVVDISDLSFKGNDYKSIRHCLNKCSKNNLTLESNFRSIEDIKKLINEWSNDYTDKYFRDFSGKNYYFYKNNFHLDCLNAFIYKDNDLVSFGTLTKPKEIGQSSSYVIGKALFKRHYGLSEYTDIELYKMAQNLGIKEVNLGRAQKGLLDYKTKFNHTKEITY